MIIISFNLMRSMEVSFPGSSDQFELKSGVLNLSTSVFSSNYSFDPWDDYARGFIAVKHVAIIGGQFSTSNFDFTWPWNIYPSKSV